MGAFPPLGRFLLLTSLFAASATAAFGQSGTLPPPAGQGGDSSASASPDSDDPLDIDLSEPLDPISGLDVEWPEDGDIPPWPEDTEPAEEEPADIVATESGAAASTNDDQDLASGADAVDEDANVTVEPVRTGQGLGRMRALDYAVTLDFVEATDMDAALRENFEDRFHALSTLEELDDETSNLAQINRRIRADLELIRRMLRVYGFYDGSVEQFLERRRGDDLLSVRFEIQPGPAYRLDEVALPGLEAAEPLDAALLRSQFGLKAGDLANADEITLARERLQTGMDENGYAFSSTGEPDLLIDHAEREGDLTLPVEPGAKFIFGTIRIGDNSPFSARHLQRIARFDPGDTYRLSMVEDLRRAILATGLVSTANLTPVENGEAVDIAVDTAPAPMRTIAGELGYGTGEGFRVSASWEHRNFFPPEGLVRLRGVLGTQEQLVNLLYRRSNFRERDQVLTAQFLAGDIQRNAFEARTLLISTALERQTNLIFQKKWTWSAGLELLISDERDGTAGAAADARQTFLIAAAPLSLSYDGSDDLLNPSSGFRLSGRLSPEISERAGQHNYARAQIDASYYQPVSESVVVAGRMRFGSIAGASLVDIAPSRRLYAGGGGSVRGYGFQRIGPLDANNDPVGGRSLAEFSLEARVRFGNFGVVPFVDAGNIQPDSVPGLSGMRYGAGVGFRYYSNFGPLRVDIGTPINPQPGDSRIGIYISLGQAF